MAQLSPLELAARKTAVQLNQPESLVEKVISHKWKSVHQAQYENRTVEDSGLGTFAIREKTVLRGIIKCQKLIDHYTNQLQGGMALTDKERLRKERGLNGAMETKKYLESKI